MKVDAKRNGIPLGLQIYFDSMLSGTEKAVLRALYKYQYYLTKREKAENPDGEQFVTEMDKLYNCYKEK